MATMSIAIGRLTFSTKTEKNARGTCTSKLQCELLQSAYFGVGNATAMLIGETLGQGNKEEAFQNGKRAVKVVMILNVHQNREKRERHLHQQVTDNLNFHAEQGISSSS